MSDLFGGWGGCDRPNHDLIDDLTRAKLIGHIPTGLLCGQGNLLPDRLTFVGLFEPSLPDFRVTI